MEVSILSEAPGPDMELRHRMPHVPPNPDRDTWCRIGSLVGLRVPGGVPDPAANSTRNPWPRAKKQDPALNPAWKLRSRARPRARHGAPASNATCTSESRSRYVMLHWIPFRTPDPARGPSSCRPHGFPDYVRRSRVPH